MLFAAACSAPATDDAGTDAARDVIFSADADPSEPTECTSAPPGAGETRAKHVVCADELLDGSLAAGRIGDIVIENARARFIVRTGTDAATTIGASAGGVIDAALHGGTDLLKELLPLLDFESIRAHTIEVVDAGGDEARVRVLFDAAPIGLLETVLGSSGSGLRLRGQIDYVMRADEDALAIQIALGTSEGVSRASATVGIVALLGAQELWQPGYGLLYDERAGSAGLPVVVGEREGAAMALALSTGQGAVLHVDSIHLVRGSRVTAVARGAIATIEARLAVGARAADALRAARQSSSPLLSLRGAPGDRVDVTTSDGALVLRSSLDVDGRASVALEPGSYLARSGFRGTFESASIAVTHPGAEVLLAAAPSANLVVAALVEGQPAIPVRVTVQRDGAELERFVAIGEVVRRFSPGDYRITISHGLEHDVSIHDVRLDAGATLRLEPDLPRVLDTSGWVSVDLHLHSDLSADSLHAVEDAIRMLAAEGVDAAAATDHDFITDYPAVAARAGVSNVLVAVPGVEVSTTVYGHINGYPLRGDPNLAARGAPVWFDRSPAEVFEALRALGDTSLGGTIVQINHPRLGSASFFGAVGLDRESAVATADPTTLGLAPETDLDDFGFDVLEVWNGYTRGGNEESFEDYLALFAANRRFTMVGNSDSHVPDRPPGSPRSFVRVPDDTAFGWTDIAASLRQGTVTVAASIFVTAELAGPRSGDNVPVRVRVQAPPWATASRLRIYAGRTIAVERPIAASSAPVRLDEIVDVPLGGASFVVARVDGDSAPEPMQHFEPVGVTNPLVVP